MTKYDVKMEPMPDNPVKEQSGLGHQTGFYLLELWERDVTSPGHFIFVRILEENLPFNEAQKKHIELLNRFNGIEPPPIA
jgi:hypothetical protein